MSRARALRTGARMSQGQRKRHRARQPIGRGNYVKAPTLTDKLISPRWQANAVINNPGHVLAAGGVGAGGGYLAREKIKKDRDNKKEAAAAAAGGGAAHFARTGADYGTKALAERQFKHLTTKGDYGPYKESPHKPALNKYKRTAKGDVRAKAKMFNENFPKGIPSYRARRAGVILNKKPVVAGSILAGAGAGAVHQKVKKADTRKDRGASGAAITGAGAVTAGTGLAAGGVPGTKSNPDIIQPGGVKEGRGKGARKKVSFAARNAPGATRASRSGILGFRTEVHRGGLYDFTEKAKHKAAQMPARGKEASHAFSHGYVHGKVAPEEKIIRHMKGGRKVAHAAFLGGTAATAYGIQRARDRVHKAEKHSDRYHGTLAGAGGAGLAVSAGAHQVLRGQQKKWRNTANTSIDEAQRLVPGLGGRKPDQSLPRYKRHLKRGGTPENFPRTMEPERSAGDIARDKKVFAGVKPDVARKAGQLRGGAAQAKHFSEVYGSTAKVVGRLRAPSAIVGAAGVGGLAATKAKKKPVAKSLSAFGVEHGGPNA